MTNPREMWRRSGVAAGAIALAALLAPGGCGGSSDDGRQAAAPPPQDTVRAPLPERPEVSTLAMSEQVEFPAERVPMDPSLAQAIADLASALASGDSSALADVLDAPTGAVLEEMQEGGSFGEATDAIERVRVTRVEERDGAMQIGLGVLDGSGAYLLGWEAIQIEGKWVFSGLAIESQSALTLAELDAAPLTVRMTPVARVEQEVLPEAAPVEEQQSGGSSRGSRGIDR